MARRDGWPVIKRRKLLKGLAASAGLGTIAATTGCMVKRAAIRSSGAVVVIGGGFAGASAARALKSLDPNLTVTLIEPKDRYVSCPFSNLVITTQRPISQQQFGYQVLEAQGIKWLRDSAKRIDPVLKQVTTAQNQVLNYDRLVMAPGIDLRFDEISGYSFDAAQLMPHAWQAGEQTLLLKQQLLAMKDGGVFVIAAPGNPYRCPPGPYERASLVASYLKQHKPRSKVLILDAKDQFSKQSLFQTAWENEYPGMIEWQGLSDGAAVIGVDAAKKIVRTEFDEVRVDVANIIPPQQAGSIAVDNGIADESGWCPVDALTFESLIAKDIHVIGDAAILNAMPKSAFAANAQAKLCAAQIVRSFKGLPALDVPLVNTCYSMIHADYGISVAGVYRAKADRWVSVPDSGGVSLVESDPKANRRSRQLEARYAADWYRAVTTEAFL